MKLKTVLNTPMEDIKPCLECGKMHTRRKFCSPYCGSKYSAKKIRASYPRSSSTNVDTIIKGQNSPISDNSFNFIFSNKIEDWLGSTNRIKRQKHYDKRKVAEHKLIKQQSDGENT